MRLAVAAEFDSAISQKLQAHDVTQCVVFVLDIDDRHVDFFRVDGHFLRVNFAFVHLASSVFFLFINDINEINLISLT